MQIREKSAAHLKQPTSVTSIINKLNRKEDLTCGLQKKKSFANTRI